MKTYNRLSCLLLTAGLLLPAGCSDSFLANMKDYAGFNDEVYDDVQTAQAKVDYIYYNCNPGMGGGSSSTLEVAGSTSYIQKVELDRTNVPNEFGQWTKIRECNITLTGLEKGKLSPGEKKTMMGETRFWRVWLYWSMVRTYGGIPLITTAQNPILGNGQSDLEVPRSSTSDCIRFLCDELDQAMDELPGAWDDKNWGRLTSGAAAALKGRILLTYASPLFNRTDDVERWNEAYTANKAAYDLLRTNGFGLAEGGGARAAKWEKMFVTRKSPEAVMVTLYNNVASTNEMRYNNGREQSCRPKEAEGGGGISVTAEIVDLFPMADGKKPAESSFPYDSLKFYKNRDPRFYRTFAFNGVVWPFAEHAAFTVWNYHWYKDEDSFHQDKAGSGSAQYGGDVASGIFLRKGSNPNAKRDDTDKFKSSATPAIEIRFAEVVLNLAESACGKGELSEAYEQLKSIRQRVGYTGDCGLEVSLMQDRDKLFGAILYERQIELAYEGKWFQDMRRWMLWNDDFGTCTRLGMAPINGMRRHGIRLAVKPDVFTSNNAKADADVFNPESAAYDPTKVTRQGRGLDPDASDAEFARQEQLLDEFYDVNLERHVNDLLDGTDLVKFPSINFRSNYYFIGFSNGIMNSNALYLEQTIGWDDYFGNPGTFDPLR
ncbi:MAG: RagB/SusD family nutrient uptake outer membrane protein [Prevotellaceae bacterium]|jgi:hypothetical protein|nr:RagB/SusD family nutrient uptake outer membrane protein [Prevotellaceae bacterium]